MATWQQHGYKKKAICEKCGLVLAEISMTQHRRLYCPMREVGNEQPTRGNRKIVRPIPPKEAKSQPPAGKAEPDIIPKIKMPYIP